MRLSYPSDQFHTTCVYKGAATRTTITCHKPQLDTGYLHRLEPNSIVLQSYDCTICVQLYASYHGSGDVVPTEPVERCCKEETGVLTSFDD